MTNSEILSHVDHTILKADAKWEDIAQLCEESLQYRTASVCIPPYYVKRAKTEYPAVQVCTVTGFPLGYQHATAKAFEAAMAVADGADEVDMVINVAALKNDEQAYVLNEIKAARVACRDQILKVIIETCYLTEEEKICACRLVSKGGADYIKTSTGFGSAGADLADIALFRSFCERNVKIKAAGGIRTREQMEAFLEAGCDRIGTSAAKILFQ